MAADRPRSTVRYDHAGRVVIVTGGCGGIGTAMCAAFASCGALAVALDVHEAPPTDFPTGLDYYRSDVSQWKECQAAVQWIVDRFGAIDVLVNNAAIQPPDSYVSQDRLPEALWQRMVAVNFSGYAFMAQAVLPIMLRQQSGVIINIASGQGHRTARQVPAYGPIKAANLMQTRQWGVEYARDGIRVVSISPGAIDTPLLRDSMKEQGGPDALANRHPIGRLGQPDEIARAALWLASDDASFVTATDLEVDGGLGAFAAFADPYQPRSAPEPR